MAKGSACKSQAAKKTPTTTSVRKTRGSPMCSIVAFAVQCYTCFKWRTLASEEQFEEFRCKQTDDPFVCNKLPGITCETPANITYDSSQVWAMDKANIPKTPKGFKRLITLRSDHSKMDVQYMTPEGKKIRAAPEMVDYLEKHPEFSHASPSDFCFSSPKIRGSPMSLVVTFAVQCGACHKWRKLENEKQFEEFRCKQTEDPFVCSKLSRITCETAANITYNSSQVWAMDKPNIPKTPKGFKRLMTLRSDYSRMDVKYKTPEGKKICAAPRMVDYLQEHPECSHASPSDCCFLSPKVMQDSIPKNVVKSETLASSTATEIGLKGIGVRECG